MHSLDGSRSFLEVLAQTLPALDSSAIPTGLADWQISALQTFTAAYPLLVTDDDAMSRMFYRALLAERCGFRLIDTGDPDEALRICQAQPVGLVISCIVKVARMDGLDLIDNLRKLPQTHFIPVLLISGSTQIRELALQAGADAYLTKPCHPNEILQEAWLLLRERVL
jgi:CheY-like chemotaxis protein